MEHNYQSRRIVIGTMNGTLEGDLQISPQLRTLDYFNRNATKFVTIHKVQATGSRSRFGRAPVRLNASNILWVAEVQSMRAPTRPLARETMNRSAVRLCFEDSEASGFLHTPAQGDPLVRLSQDGAIFIALTSASVISADTEFAAAFLAVNRQRVFAAETIGVEDDAWAENALMEEGAGRP